MSTFGGIYRSIHCRKMEKTRPMKKEMDRKMFFLAIFSIFYFDVESTFPYLYHDLSCKQLFPANEQVLIRETRVPKNTIIVLTLEPVIL